MYKLMRLFAVYFVVSVCTALYGAPIKVACVGDSITYGAGIADRQTCSYPAQLAGILGSGYQVENFGLNGATMLYKSDLPYVNSSNCRAALAFMPDIVVIKLGTNDSKPQNWRHCADFKDNYIKTVEMFRALKSNPKIYICIPAPVCEDKWGINETTVSGMIAPIIRSIAAERGLVLIDIHSALYGRQDLFVDMVHPSAQGARIMAETVASAIVRK